MSTHIFLLCLMMASVLTGLVTQAIKGMLDEWKVKYHSNTLAGVIALVVGAFIGGMYMIIAEAHWNSKMAVFLIALVLLPWLSAMVGYDKVMQAISQFKSADGKDADNEKE